MSGQAAPLAEIPFDALVTFFVLLVGLPAVGLQPLAPSPPERHVGLPHVIPCRSACSIKKTSYEISQEAAWHHCGAIEVMASLTAVGDVCFRG